VTRTSSLVDHYAVLRVRPDATPRLIEAAYRALTFEYHPDHHPGDPRATRNFALLGEAHEVLADPAGRAAYDAVRAAYIRTHGRPPPDPLARPEPDGSAPPRAGTRREAPDPGTPDRPVMSVEPDSIELRPSAGDSIARFTVVVRQTAGPLWEPGRHVLDVVFDPPWRPALFRSVVPRTSEPPFRVDFELRLSDLAPAERMAGGVHFEVKCIEVS
jgi:DnaJ domain